MASDLLTQFTEKAISKRELTVAIEKDTALLPIIIKGVESPKAHIRYTCAGLLVNLSEKHPEKLYDHMDFFVGLLDSNYRILKWNGMAAISNLCKIDVKKKFDMIFDKYYSFLNDEYMVTVANVVANSAKIAQAKPYFVPQITRELLRVQEIHTTPHLTEECTRVINEKTIECFDKFFTIMNDKEKANAVSFVKRQLDSTRASLRKEAQLFLKRHNS
ncbi:MAG TPA: hypothetical protein VK209_08220 [Candidatus Sulfotelmatobacter sp.]|jgi:hypothetical protein|nr:hypothetical protein [Candidatus Sulfotelmatobacter sp.]